MPAKVAKLRPAPMEPADLDGWSVDDMKSWAIPAARQLAEAEERLEGYRASLGLVLYRLRLDLGDGVYGETLSEILRETGVSARTLERWRRRAEEHFQLPPPSARSVSQRATKRQGVSLRAAPGSDTVASSAAVAAPPQERDRPAPAAPTVAAPPLALPEPAPLVQPSSRDDYVRLVALLETAGPAVLARSVPVDRLRAAIAVLRQAVKDAAPVEAAGPSRCSCPDPKPERSKTTGLIICTRCGKLRP